ncbi:MAG: tRNA uracil 4-sulfurtransferase ThiI [Bacillota bacterium]|jgi:thiamine biosynthesis protein ThiI|nr:tRNA 4-thiouridine(8) synthase ThiI [Candidatus Fermentithermobacillaceae bacterium]
MEELLLVKYGEISLKGKNRYQFEAALMDHIRFVVGEYPGARLEKAYGRVYIHSVPGERNVLRRLAKIPGIVAVAPALRVENEIIKIRDVAVEAAKRALEMLDGTSTATFKAESRRSLKSFPLTSPQISHEVGSAVLAAGLGLTVDVHRPSFVINVEVREKGTFVYWHEVRGMGGLPLGSSGRGIVLLSGGIDSPVAAYLAMKRGVALEALHFWSFPITGERARDKVVRIWRVLKDFDPQMRLHIAHFTKIQTAIMESCPEKYRVTVMRRMMMRVSTRLAERVGALAIFTGENLGQVASQTLESMAVIEDTAGVPVLRPLLTYDKRETVEIAERIGTYELSCLPYEDCCTVFVPKHPVTKPRLELVRDAEKALPVDELVEECVRGIETLER